MINCEVKITMDRTQELLDEVRESLKQAIIKSCYDTEAHAKASAPVDTGNLKNSITTDLSQLNNLEGGVGTDVEYAVYVEFGTVNTPAQPHILPAFEFVGSEFANVAAALLNRRFK